MKGSTDRPFSATDGFHFVPLSAVVCLPAHLAVLAGALDVTLSAEYSLTSDTSAARPRSVTRSRRLFR